MGTRKGRKGPLASATQYKVGTVMKGSDGNMWKIVATAAGIKRWNRVQGTQKRSVTLEELNKLKKTYKVTTTGTKEEIAYSLWKKRRSGLDNADLKFILPLLPQKDKKAAKALMEKRSEATVTDYKGMWEPQPNPLSQMSREELVTRLRKFRNAWEKITDRNQDLSNDRLASEDEKGLRSLLEFYYSDSAKQLAEEWLLNL
jgi:hypothetical protein